jgi:transcription elongation GreA/GreB family factor
VSVAFRRDCDEEHLEPRFELPIPAGPNLVTQRGLKQIEAHVARCEARVAAEADEMQLNDAKRDLRYWRKRLITAEIAPTPPPDQVAFGSRVTFEMNGAVRVINIVGCDEADPANGYIAFSAPLPRALMGTGAGDIAEFAGKHDAIEVIEVGICPSSDLA